jgi:PAS domain S-box-containing protein
MKPAQLRALIYAAIPVLAGGIFVAGLSSPLGIVNCVWYFIPLLLSVYVGGRILPFGLAALLSVLIMAGYYLPSLRADAPWAFESRVMSVGVLWVAALLISQHKRMGQQMRTLSRAADQSPVSIVITDKAGNIEYVNRKFTEVTGYSAREVIGKNPRILKSGEMSLEGYRRLWETITGGGEWRGEFHNKKKNGELYWEAASISPVFDAAGDIIHFMAVKEDITQRKQAEAALAWISALFENSQDICCIKDLNLQVRAANGAFLRAVGAKSLGEVIGKTDAELFCQPENAPHVAGFMADERQAQALPPGGQITREERLIRPDGAEQIQLTRKFPVYDQAGRLIATANIATDITISKQAEEARRQSASLLQATLESTADGILVINLAGQIIGFNKRFLQLWRIPENIVASRNDQQALTFVLDQLSHPEAFLARVRELYDHPEEESFDVVEFKDGRVFERYSHPQRVEGRPVGRVWSFRDVTERKRAEERAREEAMLLDLAQDAIIVRDMEDRILYWNKGAEQLFGWTRSEAMGQPVWKLLHEEPDKYQNAMKLVQEKGRWIGELTCQDKKGHKLIVETRLNLVNDPQGKPRSILSISTNITEKKKLEAQFLRSQRMESLGTLAGGIAHDLNNVLTPLLVAVQVLKEKVTDPDGLALLESLQTNVQRGSSLVKQVLAFGRGVEGERAVIQPKNIAREIKQIVQETFPKSMEFEFQTTPDLWSIVGDTTQLHQVLLNLCVNARDAMPQGGKLSIHMENVTLDDTYADMNLEAETGPYVLIRVADTGTGMPREIQEKIFDPFFTTKEQGKGTGLGLSTTLAIVKSHGGFINCYSEPGKGAVFKVYLPASITPAAEKTAARQSSLPHGHNELVLVVDDEEPILKVARKTLERFGYRVLLAANGAEAVALFKSHHQEIAAVIMDMAMPVMDGAATITALKAIHPGVKVISSSGLSTDGGVVETKGAGVKHFIPKPYTAETMLDTLHALLHEKPGN